jgi:hypothetical protein
MSVMDDQAASPELTLVRRRLFVCRVGLWLFGALGILSAAFGEFAWAIAFLVTEYASWIMSRRYWRRLESLTEPASYGAG